ncbi:MAG: hypothetical protein ACOVP5_02605 [Chitinophagales bacterium]
MRIEKKALLLIATLVFFTACIKDDEQEGYLEPIAILSPTTNPANTSIGSPIVYKVTFTNDAYIDSAYLYSMLDSNNSGHVASMDSLFRKVIYPIGAKRNVQTVEGSIGFAQYPRVGGAIHLTFVYFSNLKRQEKRLKLNVI